MLYQDWVDKHWDPGLISDEPAFVARLNQDKQRGMDRIEKLFTEKPKYVVKISRDTFISLPSSSKNSGWPDFTPIIDWIKENSIGAWYQYDPVYYIFVSEIDGTAFKLRRG